MTAETPTPRTPAAFINAIAEEGTKEEAVEFLQRTRDDYCQCKRELAQARAEITRLRAELAAARERARKIEHLAWHVCESSEDRVTEDEIVVDRKDFEALCAVLPEEHP